MVTSGNILGLRHEVIRVDSMLGSESHLPAQAEGEFDLDGAL